MYWPNTSVLFSFMVISLGLGYCGGGYGAVTVSCRVIISVHFVRFRSNGLSGSIDVF